MVLIVVTDCTVGLSAAQNFYGCLSAIKEGTLYYPLGDAKLTHVDYSDVGKVCA